MYGEATIFTKNFGKKGMILIIKLFSNFMLYKFNK